MFTSIKSLLFLSQEFTLVFTNEFTLSSYPQTVYFRFLISQTSLICALYIFIPRVYFVNFPREFTLRSLFPRRVYFVLFIHFPRIYFVLFLSQEFTWCSWFSDLPSTAQISFEPEYQQTGPDALSHRASTPLPEPAVPLPWSPSLRPPRRRKPAAAEFAAGQVEKPRLPMHEAAYVRSCFSHAAGSCDLQMIIHAFTDNTLSKWA